MSIMVSLLRFRFWRVIAVAARCGTLAAGLSTLIAVPATAQLIGNPLEIPGQIGRDIGRTVPDDRGLRDRVEDVAETVEEEVDAGIESVEETADTAVDAVEDIVAAALEVFADGADPSGQRIEREVWVVLVPAEHADQIPGWGFTIRERRDLEGLDLVMIRIDAPEERGMRETELDLDRNAPGTVVDFNHIYGAGADEPRPEAGTFAANASSVDEPRADTGDATPTAGAALAVGVIDSAVAQSHEALHGIELVQEDFVPFEGERPTRHGTAVASILVESAKMSAAGALRLYVASVFFTDEGNETIATTGSLVAALEWLGGYEVGVINMSLTGPPNRVLEAALAAVAKRNVVVVAAVGNEGPASKPLYPAAYDTVVGITAVDSENRIYRHANRGEQVAFAALGVRAKVAKGDGGYGRETGTSMAAPVAAVIIARALAVETAPSSEVLTELQRTAVDLGERGFDPVYGFGLITPIH